MLSTLLQCCIVILIQIKLAVFVVVVVVLVKREISLTMRFRRYSDEHHVLVTFWKRTKVFFFSEFRVHYPVAIIAGNHVVIPRSHTLKSEYSRLRKKLVRLPTNIFMVLYKVVQFRSQIVPNN